MIKKPTRIATQNVAGGEKIKVAFFLPSLEPGGAERNVVNIVNNIDRQKYDVSLVLSEAKGNFLSAIRKDVPIINLDISGNLKLFFRLVKYFRNEDIDIFVSAFPRFNAVSLLAKKFSGSKIKIMITEHLSFLLLPKTAKTLIHRLIARFLFPYFIRFFYPGANAVICVSQGIADEISVMTIRQGNISVIYNPVADENILQLAQAKVDHAWFLDSKVPVIVMVGRLSKTKDQPTLFEALDIIVKKRPARLVLVGDGSEKQKLENLARQLGLSDRVAFLGFQDNPYKYMKRASVFVLSSLQEGFGNVIVEAMVCGTPVVATNCKSGPSEIIQDGVNGLLVPPQDAGALADAITRILDYPALAQRFLKQGRIRAEHFSVKKSVAEYENTFAKLMQ